VTTASPEWPADLAVLIVSELAASYFRGRERDPRAASEDREATRRILAAAAPAPREGAATPGQARQRSPCECGHLPAEHILGKARRSGVLTHCLHSGCGCDLFRGAPEPDVIDAAAPAEPQVVPGDWWICDGPLPAARKLLGPFATQELALNVRSYVEKAEKRSDLWVDDEPQQPQPAPGPYYVSLGVTDDEVARGEDFGRYDFPNLRKDA
jgi:hypothetical protein